MRELNWAEYCSENNANSTELEKIVKLLRKKKGSSVPHNFIHQAEKDLDAVGKHIIGNVTIKYIPEEVIVIDTCDKDELNEYIEGLNVISYSENDSIYNIKFVGVINKPVIEGTGDIFDIYTTTEAALLWGMHESTVRKAIQQGKFTFGVDYRKAGRVTLISKKAMVREYGPLK